MGEFDPDRFIKELDRAVLTAQSQMTSSSLVAPILEGVFTIIRDAAKSATTPSTKAEPQ